MNQNTLLTINVTVLLIFTLFIIPTNAVILQQHQASPQTVTLTYNFNTPILNTIQVLNKTFTRIEIENLPFSNPLGKPVIPQKLVCILLPSQQEITTIDVKSLNTHIRTDTSLTNIKLGSISQRLTQSNKQSQEYYQTLSYNESQYYPTNNYNNIGIQYKNGFPILYLILYPVQYLQSENKIKYATQMKITIETKSTPKTSPLYKSQFSSEITGLVDNPETVYSYQTSNTLSDHQNTPYNDYDYVIITTEELRNTSHQYLYTFEDLIDLRTNQGLSCAIKTVEEIEDEYFGVDVQEKIRNYIKFAYIQYNTQWILLGGDVEKVPIRCLYDVDGQETDEKQVPSDVYYQCLDGTYNYDGDEHWGEEFDGINGGRIDLSAEVYIGRAPIDDEQDLSAFVEKTIVYENSVWEEDDYLKNVLSVGEELWSGPGGYGAGYVERCIDFCTDYNQETYGIPSDQYTITELYERDTIWNDDDVITNINEGIALINHVGHGNSVSAMKLSSIELEELDNTGKYSLFYTQACHAGQLDKQDECFAEKWVNIPKKGGFAAIMNTGYGYGSAENYDGADNRYAREFYDALFSPNEQISKIGKANQDSKEDNIWHITDENMFHGYYDTTLFGDPYVSIKGAEEAAADFNWSPEYPTTGKMIRFYDVSEGVITYRKWDFGDGTLSFEKNPIHVFSSAKIYDVSLTVMDQHGYVSTETIPVEVRAYWNPIAKIIPSSYNGVNFTIQFSADESWDPDGDIVRYHWDFDDGTTASTCDPLHTFDSEGMYTVCLTVEDNEGNVDRAYSNIVLSFQFPPHTPSDLDGPTSTFSGKNTLFSIVATDPEGDDIQYCWDWDDESEYEWTEWYPSGQMCEISHKWDSLGEHHVKVKARDRNFGESNWSQELIIMVTDETSPILSIENPTNGIYLSNKKLLPFPTTLVFGDIDICVTASDSSGIEKILFYLDDTSHPIAEVLSEPYVFSWNEQSFGKHVLRVVAIDYAGKQSSSELTIWKFF